MLGKRVPGDKKKSRRSKEDRDSRAPKPAAHPLYGVIPFIHHKTVGLTGKVYEWWQEDPDYQPKLPRGAIRGNVKKQNYCPAHHTPKYFYVDEAHTCIQCGKNFIFRPEEQKYWYETLQFNFSSIPIRCAECRRARRSEHALREQIARAKTDIRRKNPAGHIALARSIVEYRERTQHGDLSEAIAAARKAKAIWPESVEPSLWEGIAHALAGRNEKARTTLTSFLTQAKNAPGAWRTKAEKYLQEL
jgi:hypothetical protein